MGKRKNFASDGSTTSRIGWDSTGSRSGRLLVIGLRLIESSSCRAVDGWEGSNSYPSRPSPTVGDGSRESFKEAGKAGVESLTRRLAN